MVLMLRFWSRLEGLYQIRWSQVDLDVMERECNVRQGFKVRGPSSQNQTAVTREAKLTVLEPIRFGFTRAKARFKFGDVFAGALVA